MLRKTSKGKAGRFEKPIDANDDGRAVFSREGMSERRFREMEENERDSSFARGGKIRRTAENVRVT